MKANRLFYTFAVCVFFFASFLSFPLVTFGQNISAPNEICPALPISITIDHSLSPLVWYSIDEYSESNTFIKTHLLPPPENSWPVSEGRKRGPHSITDGFSFVETISPTNEAGKVVVRTWTGPSALAKTFTIYKRLKRPAAPNNGVDVHGCFPGDEIPISSLPLLTLTPTDCDFHCDYLWNAPSGFTFKRTGYTNSNPQRWAEKLVFPSGLPDGPVSGSGLRVTALYSECGYASNSESYATPIVYGKPIISNPQIETNGVSGYILSLENFYNYTLEWSIVASSGGTISPIGNIGECYTFDMTWGIVKVKLTNKCGSTEYNFYIGLSSMYTVYPNPVVDNKITIDFENIDFSKRMLNNITLLNARGEKVRIFDNKDSKTANFSKTSKSVNFDTTDLPSGTYYLHIDTNLGIDKKQIILN